MAVMFAEATPEDKLLKMLKETEHKHRISDKHRIKFVTKSGIKLKHLLERKDPFMSECGDNECNPCVNSKSKSGKTLNCKKNRVCYEARCRNCEKEGKLRVYHGETARNIHTRSKEHYQAYKNKSDKSFMNKHVVKEHGGNGDEVVFDWKLNGKFRKPLSRQVAEAVKFEKQQKM